MSREDTDGTMEAMGNRSSHDDHGNAGRVMVTNMMLQSVRCANSVCRSESKGRPHDTDEQVDRVMKRKKTMMPLMWSTDWVDAGRSSKERRKQ
jgi:hypothetical protein